MKIIINTDVLIQNGNNPEPNDNFVIEEDDRCFGLSGIVLNNISETNDIPQYIIDGSIQKRYKGSYVAWLYDKKDEKIYVSNDLLSKQSVYFYDTDGVILINTSLFDLCADLRANGRIPQMDLKAIQYFCRENVFCGDMTYESDTRFLTAYSYLLIDCKKKNVEVKKLSIPPMKNINEITDSEAVEELEKRFTAACELQWYKNEQYGKKQIFTVSGGMDSRAVLLHMVKLHKATSATTYTYAQSGSADEIIAKRITSKLGIDNHFIPLDNCEFVYQRDEIIDANEGQMYYAGSTGAILMAKMTQREENGIVHTGLGGGEIMGDICASGGDAIQDQDSTLTSNQRTNLDDIRRCLNFQKTTSGYFYAFSPFLDEDFFEYAMCLPTSMRSYRKLYIKWYKQYMNSDYPSAMSHSLALKAVNKVRRKMYTLLGKRNPADMNPFQYWFDSQPKLRDYIEETFRCDCEELTGHSELLEILSKFFDETVIRKLAVLTVTGSVKRMLGIKE